MCTKKYIFEKIMYKRNILHYIRLASHSQFYFSLLQYVTWIMFNFLRGLLLLTVSVTLCINNTFKSSLYLQLLLYYNYLFTQWIPQVLNWVFSDESGSNKQPRNHEDDIGICRKLQARFFFFFLQSVISTLMNCARIWYSSKSFDYCWYYTWLFLPKTCTFATQFANADIFWSLSLSLYVFNLTFHWYCSMYESFFLQ